MALESFELQPPAYVRVRLKARAPSKLAGLGNRAIFDGPMTALFCSSRCPGDRLLRTYEYVQNLRDRGVTVISGFHSPIEKECLRILLRGRQFIIICPARTLKGMVIPADWQRALDTGRLLLLSPFPPTQRRASLASANRRNELVAALSDEVFIAHITPGGQMERTLERAKTWRIPISSP